MELQWKEKNDLILKWSLLDFVDLMKNGISLSSRVIVSGNNFRCINLDL